MRDIKFRVWTKSGEPLILEPGWLGDYHWGIGKGVDVGEEAPTILEQFTGLKDAKGVEIYEGDIVQYDHVGVSPREGVVIWGEYKDNEYVDYLECWMVDERPLSCMTRYTGYGYGCVSMVIPNSIRVIGNIHQNPDLLT